MPEPDAVALIVARQACGTVNVRAAGVLARAGIGFTFHDGMLELDDAGLDFAGRSARLHQAALCLQKEGIVQSWRNEQLEVRAQPDDPALATIDRCAVRVLGITTYSVHLNGFLPDGQLLVALRSARKRVDPGLWDNLAGGMISAGESIEAALARETHEEAGIQLASMPVTAGSRFQVRRPIGEGILAEVVHVFDVELPAGVHVENLDGEVDRFEARRIADVLGGIELGEFTVEAALATLDALQRRGWRPPDP
jgi:8-oxo-dGTP pyrophosphatase MutT (NUDIX family)